MPRALKTKDRRPGRTVDGPKDTSNAGRIDVSARRCPSRSLIGTILLLLAAVLGGGSCATKKPLFRAECPSLDAGDYYFPEGALDPTRARIDKLLRDRYSSYLRAMMEPSLSCGTRVDGYAYRFLWLRSFHHPIVVRIEKAGPAVTLNAVELEGTGGDKPGQIIRRVQRLLSPAEQDKFLAKLNEVSAEEMQKNLIRFGVDGAQWVVEGVKNGQYQLVDKWTPGRGAYRDCGVAFLSLAGFSIPAEEMY